MVTPHYTPKVRRLASQVMGLTSGELLALNEILRGFTPPPGAGVREPAGPQRPNLEGGATADADPLHP